MILISLFFLSVMEKLPVTSYIRLVDIWLIFGQLIPFMQVIMFWKTFCKSSFIPQPRLLCLQFLKFSMKMTSSTIMVLPEVSPLLNLWGNQKLNFGQLPSLLVKLLWKTKIFWNWIVYLERKGLPTFVVVFASSYILIASLYYFNILDW